MDYRAVRHRTYAPINSLDHALHALGRDRVRQSMSHEIEIEAHLVTELDEHEAISAREKARLVIDHGVDRCISRGVVDRLRVTASEVRHHRQTGAAH